MLQQAYDLLIVRPYAQESNVASGFDVGLPGMEFLKYVRDNPSTRTVPAIVVSDLGDLMDNYAFTSKKGENLWDTVKYMAFPFTERRLVSAVRESLSKSL